MITISKAWGTETTIVNNRLYCGKRFVLHKGFQSSLHYHKEKHETFFVESGKVQLM